ncbi:MAG: hypothetical protein IT438_12000 [Phycisphaerales bacterium]|nr:hypothetical protein [Phycisphaerales bacterium]
MPSNARTLQEWIEHPGLDTAIRASTRINSILASNMTLYAIRNPNPAGSSVFHEYPTRIETPEIGTLELTAMEAGVIWSGRLDGIGTVPGTRDPALDYCRVENLSIGTVGSAASLYIKEFGPADFSESVFGEINVPVLGEDETIKIAGSLGEACCSSASAIPPGCFRAPVAITEVSPRAVGCRARSLISIRQSMGLQGQIVINADNVTPSDQWLGDVVVNAGDANPANRITLSPNQPQPHAAPYYAMASAMLGGGAVGLVPFRIHEGDCEPKHRVRENPSNPVLVSTNVIPSAAFDTPGATPGMVRFYGPILVDSGVNTNLIDMASEMADEVCGRTWMGAGSMFSITGPDPNATGIATRTLSIGRNPNSASVHVGEYRVRVKPKHAVAVGLAGTRVAYWRVCTDDLDEPESEAYFFRVAEGSGVFCEMCPGDFNCNGSISVQDIFDFLTAYFTGGCIGPVPPICTSPLSTNCIGDADVNNSCSVTVQDIFDFLDHWFSGC